MEYRIPKPGDIYKHFKGNLYEIVIIARDSETLEEKVVYKSVDGDSAYVRTLSMFLSKVDHVKYPNVKQEYRFELVDKVVDKEPKMENGSMIMDFLDKNTAYDKLQYLIQKKDFITDNFLCVVAQSLDFTESKESLSERYDDILHYLRTISKYENSRFR